MPEAFDYIRDNQLYAIEGSASALVITRGGHSDWSVMQVPRVTGPQQVRLTRRGNAAIVHFLGHDGQWHLLRLGDFPVGAVATCMVTVEVTTIGTFTNSVVIDADQVDPILPNNDDEVPVSAGEPQIVPSEVPGLGTGPSWLLALLILLAAGWHTRERR